MYPLAPAAQISPTGVQPRMELIPGREQRGAKTCHKDDLRLSGRIQAARAGDGLLPPVPPLNYHNLLPNCQLLLITAVGYYTLPRLYVCPKAAFTVAGMPKPSPPSPRCGRTAENG